VVEPSELTPRQQEMVRVWEAHLAAEFERKSAQAALDTMVPQPYVNHLPVLTGGVGPAQIGHFYQNYFIPQMPPDTEIVPISRTVGQDRLVDEFVFRFTHSVQMDWLVPGVPPTGRRVEVVKVVVVQFEGDRIVFERIHWDQASVLVQLGLLDPAKFPVAGAEAVRKVLDPYGEPSNLMMKRAVGDERL
jgi:carboxymethylenebutenolidase